MCVPVPPINLLNINSALFLLLRFPLLAGTGPGERLDKATQVYYHQSDGNRSAPAH
jgi:hypothetical protein